MPAVQRWLVVGAAGQLGSTATSQLASRAAVVALTRRDLDVTDHAAVMDRVSRERPDVVLNASAYNAVDAAEDDPVSALAVNAWAVQSLARAAASVGAVLLHYSTDFVFDGTASVPYAESDATAPRSVYGQSKLIGEWLAAAAPAHYVLRVESLFGGPAAHGSIDKIVTALRAGQPARVFVDRVVTPSYVEDVVNATWRLVETRAPFGTYHVVNSGETTWYGLGEAVSAILGLPPQLESTRMADAKLRAPRPQYCALSNARLRALGIDMPTWQDALARYLA
jgi:dTDP-4-dehydrorhamnose reductase